jgi:hypothetical protein
MTKTRDEMNNVVEDYLRTELKEAVRLLDLQRWRYLYSMDEQLKAQREVVDFLRKHQ